MTDDICVVCGEARAVHTHHRKLRSQGGGDEATNTLRTCAACHLAIHANPSESYARGLLVHSWADPADVRIFTTALGALEAKIGRPEEEVVNWMLAPTEGESCPTCNRRVPHKKKETSPTTKVWSTRVPIDDAETFSELVDAAAEHHGLSSKPHHRYWTMLFAVTLLLQQEKGELPVG